LIRHGKLRFGHWLRFGRGVKRLPYALNRNRRSLAFARGRGALE
jgi:hypothetical protein